MTRQKLSHLPRQVSPTRPRSSTRWSMPPAASSWLSDRPAWPAPTMMTSTADVIAGHCNRGDETGSAAAPTRRSRTGEGADDRLPDCCAARSVRNQDVVSRTTDFDPVQEVALVDG